MAPGSYVEVVAKSYAGDHAANFAEVQLSRIVFDALVLIKEALEKRDWEAVHGYGIKLATDMMDHGEHKAYAKAAAIAAAGNEHNYEEAKIAIRKMAIWAGGHW